MKPAGRRTICSMSSNLDEALARSTVASSEWASTHIAGDADTWTVLDNSSPSVRSFSVAGLKGEVAVSQPIDPESGAPMLHKAAAEAIALSLLRESADACTGVLPFEFVPEQVRDGE